MRLTSHHPGVSETIRAALARQDVLAAQMRQASGPIEPFDWLTPGLTIPGRFEEMVARVPDRPAALDAQGTMTYQELDSATNQMANAILSGPGSTSDMVALFVSEDTAGTIAALGTLKSGKAFVGFDDVFPESRSAEILADTDSTLIICDEYHLDLARHLAGSERHVLKLVDIQRFGTDSPGVSISPDDIAILNYSSGTTGRPKGIVQTHHSALGMSAGAGEMAAFGPNDRVARLGSLAWAGVFFILFGGLCYGACTVRIDLQRYSVEEAMDWLAASEITAINGRPRLRQIIASAGSRRFPSVRWASLGGDTIYRRDIEGIRQIFPMALASVSLGVTEAGRVTDWLIDRDMPLQEEVMPVGYAGPGVRVLVLDELGQELPHGASGEIAIQSSYLARGYWGQSELTAKKFRREPRYGDLPVYLTGDLGQIGEDGMLRHLGRMDFQVKIRGYQVPTNEIEGMLLRQPGVSEAVVVKHLEGDEGFLLSYIATEADADVYSDQLQAVIATQLPAHMVPQRIIFLPKLPRNDTGKVDRSRLPAPSPTRPHLQTAFRAPATPLENQIATIWGEVLGLEGVGMDDDFIALGGDSLRAAQLVNRVVNKLRVDLPYSDLLGASTVSSMVDMIHSFLLSRVSEDELSAMMRDIKNEPGAEQY